jgi:hypothetical protein
MKNIGIEPKSELLLNHDIIKILADTVIIEVDELYEAIIDLDFIIVSVVILLQCELDDVIVQVEVLFSRDFENINSNL